MGNFIWKLFGQKYLLGGAVVVYKALEGNRSTLVTVAMVLAYVAKTLGLIPPEIADALLVYLGGVGGPLLLEKFKRWDSDYNVQARAAELRKAAAERLAVTGELPSAPAATPLALDPAVLAEAERLVKELQGLRG